MTDEEKKQEMDKQRASCLYEDDLLMLRYKGNAVNFPKDQIIYAEPRSKRFSHLPYPQPKWIACDYYIEDLDGDSYRVAQDRYGKLQPGFEWVRYVKEK